MSPPDLAQSVADKIISIFNDLNLKSGKPVTRSNGVREWTVMAGIVIIENDHITPIAITTGVKALPDNVRHYSNGLIVHDMHAEILCLRAFNRFLIHQCLAAKNGDVSFVEKNGDKFKLRDEVRIGLLVTEPPCGDASMGYLAAIPTTRLDLLNPELEPKLAPLAPLAPLPPLPLSQPSLIQGSLKRQIEHDNPDLKRRLVRGRNFYSQLGIVRTKPGRRDSIETLSKSCSDKLCIKQKLGLNNCITRQFLDPIYLDYLFLHTSKYNKLDFDRCFGRLGKPMQVLTYSEDNYKFHKDPSYVPSPLSLVYMVWNNETQVINNGVRNGSYVKKKPPKRGGESVLCNQSMYKESVPLLTGEFTRYSQLKQCQSQMKQEAREILGNWVPTTTDDFDISTL